MKSRQQNLFKEKSRTTHGGNSTKGKRKEARPLAKNRWIHLVLKSTKANGPMSFLNSKHRILIENIIRTHAKKNGILIADLVNMGNHFHLKIKIQNRDLFQTFLKAITSVIARIVTGAKKGNPFGRFWDDLAFTRVLKTSFEDLQLRGYFKANRLEAERSYQTRKDYLESFNDWLSHLKSARASSS